MFKTPLYFPNQKKCPLTKRDTKLPLNDGTLLNPDWLSFAASSRGNFVDTPKFLLSLEPADHGTQRFNKLYYVKHLDAPDHVFAEVQADPRPRFLAKNLVLVKLSNRFLYSKDLQHYINVLLGELDLTFKYFSRLDLALDFQRFPMRRELSVDDFFEKIASRDYRIRSHKSISNPFRDDQDVKSRGRKIKQLSFGSRRSFVYIVMYNKSLEMRQKKHKPYIMQAWEKAGFDKHADTYRLEFSIKLKQDFVDFQTGEVINKQDLSLLSPSNLSRVFRTYFLKHFRIVKSDNNRLQRCTPVSLFSLAGDSYMQLDLSDKKDAHIHTKSRIKSLYKRLQSMNIQDREIMYSGLNYYLSELVHEHYLHLWFSKNFPGYSLPEYNPSPAPLGQQITLFNN